MKNKSVLEFFEVRGLFGYKTLSISFDHNITIAAAENGNGKTTLLSMLYAVLSGDVSPLLGYTFDELLIKFRGSKTIVISKKSLLVNGDNFEDKDTPFVSYLQVLQEELTSEGFQQMDSILRKLADFDFYRISKELENYGLPRLPRSFVEDYLSVIRDNSSLGEVKDYLEANQLEVLYFPTYRRIESSDPNNYGRKRNPRLEERHLRERERSLEHIKYEDGSWDNAQLMNFGLNDVDNRLNQICSSIKDKTLHTYAKISRSLLDDLLETTSTKSSEYDYNIKTMEVILGRLGKKKSSDAVSKVKELIRTGDIYTSENSTLSSLLFQLNEVYKQTQADEEAIESFITVINSYWEESFQQEKEFVFDKIEVKTQIFNLITNELIELNSLSSGEKQIISIFARLYLDIKKNYLILIDEPELSLSLPWQRKFLVDIKNSPSCKQLFAITHSPYIFDNELQKYAKSLVVDNIKELY